jgi:hypothetical protein
LFRAIRNIERRCLFRLNSLKCNYLIIDEKEGAGKLKAEKSLANDRVKKQFSFIVDADDKNCLAELTVVLKPNQGVRQWLYIIAGVLFPACRQAGFVLSFAQAKERT